MNKWHVNRLQLDNICHLQLVFLTNSSYFFFFLSRRKCKSNTIFSWITLIVVACLRKHYYRVHFSFLCEMVKQMRFNLCNFLFWFLFVKERKKDSLMWISDNDDDTSIFVQFLFCEIIFFISLHLASKHLMVS